jgi:hypothetical protein
MGFFGKGVPGVEALVVAAPGLCRLGVLARQAEPPPERRDVQPDARWPATPAGAPVDPADPRLAPIAGVTLATYAAISKSAATEGVDQAGLVRLALARGVASEEAWRTAQRGWNARLRGDAELATLFGRLYQAAGA